MRPTCAIASWRRLSRQPHRDMARAGKTIDFLPNRPPCTGLSIAQHREYRFHRHATTGSGDAFQIESDHSEPEVEAMNSSAKDRFGGCRRPTLLVSCGSLSAFSASLSESRGSDVPTHMPARRRLRHCQYPILSIPVPASFYRRLAYQAACHADPLNARPDRAKSGPCISI